MNLEEMISEVRNIVQDSYWTDANIATYINQGLKVVAQGVLLTNKVELTPPLPTLYTSDFLEVAPAGNGIVDLPDDFDRELMQVINSDGESLSLDPSFKRFMIKNPRMDTGAVRVCSRHGSRLIYRDIPTTTEILTVHYYRKPTLLVAPNDEPDCLPEILHKSVLVGHACVEIFNQLEDGIDGKKANAEFWLNEFRQGLFNNLALIAGDAQLPDFYQDKSPRVA